MIDADILEHKGKGAIFLRQFTNFFQKKCQKGEKQRISHLKMFWEQSVVEISKRKKKISKST